MVNFILHMLGCIRQNCPSHFESRGLLNENDGANKADDNIFDFSGIDATNKREIEFFANVWKNISECDAQIHVPAKEKPC